MANLRLVYSAATGQFAKAFAAMSRPMAVAATAAIRDAANEAKTKGRANIAAAGFSRKWQNALRANVYPSKGISLDPAAFVFHKIPFASAFEDGAKISGSPLLWLPLPTIPQRSGGKRMTPKLFQETIGKLYSLRVSGRPMLAAYIRVSAVGSNLTVAKLKSGARAKAKGGAAKLRLVPVFVGISTVQLQKRFALKTIIRAAARKVPASYVDHLRRGN